jgi:hypothetical protein
MRLSALALHYQPLACNRDFFQHLLTHGGEARYCVIEHLGFGLCHRRLRSNYARMTTQQNILRECVRAINGARPFVIDGRDHAAASR